MKEFLLDMQYVIIWCCLEMENLLCVFGVRVVSGIIFC